MKKEKLKKYLIVIIPVVLIVIVGIVLGIKFIKPLLTFRLRLVLQL